MGMEGNQKEEANGLHLTKIELGAWLTSELLDYLIDYI